MPPALALIRPAPESTARAPRGRARTETSGASSGLVADAESLAQADERRLVGAAQRGDRDAFGALVHAHQRRAYSVARAIVATHEDAEDAVQEGFLHAYRALDRFLPGQPFGAWLHRIVANAALDLTRRRRVRDADALPDNLATGVFDPAEASDLRTRLEAALTTLSDRQRAVIVLHDVQGFRHGEIGRLLGIPEGTARSDLFHARLALRQGLRVLREVP
jgi:RNA polymerase sigma-70 factor, ECF subfamily